MPAPHPCLEHVRFKRLVVHPQLLEQVVLLLHPRLRDVPNRLLQQLLPHNHVLWQGASRETHMCKMFSKVFEVERRLEGGGLARLFFFRSKFSLFGFFANSHLTYKDGSQALSPVLRRAQLPARCRGDRPHSSRGRWPCRAAARRSASRAGRLPWTAGGWQLR